ncbi:Methyl-CpG-binding domain-containing protein 5, partial [Bienertia sinuspersici]
MGDQIKGEDWLPEGWKVEIRVRKSGKKDRYYTDPVNGYIFRSLKDIDRYLLSGKLGKHVTKNNKPVKSLDSESSSFDFIQHILCQTSVLGQKRVKDESKREKSGAENSKETVQKTVSDDSNSLSIPNLSDIIDSMLMEKEGSKTVYLSAPAIGSLLGEKLSENRTNSNHNNNNHTNSNKKPKVAVNKCKDSGIISANKVAVKKDDSGYNQELSHAVEKSGIMMVADKTKEEPTECLQFEDLFDDPCIDFAIKTLTGTSAFGGAE